jgi:tRNA(Ile)-lysidine synthase
VSDNGRNILVQKAHDTIQREKMLVGAKNVLVALSGGADSMALLHFFIQQRDRLGIVNLFAAHINHGLRGEEADRDQNFVIEQCKALDIPLSVHKADVAKEAELAGEGIEEAGRRIRYKFLYDTAIKTDAYIATAHTLSDSIETVLLHQTRGCGLQGLYGIPPIREMSQRDKKVKIIRPLIDCTRTDIEEFCLANSIPFVDDSTNCQTDFARNRVRICIMPNLKSINPDVESAFSRLMRHVRQDGELLDEYAADALKRTVMKDGYKGYNAKALSCLPPALRSRAICFAVKDVDKEVSRKITDRHISLIEDILIKGGAVSLSDQLEARVSQGRFLINKLDSETKIQQSKIHLNIGIYCKFYGKIYRPTLMTLDEFEKRKKIHKNLLKFALNYDKITGNLFLRSRQPGDTFSPAGRGVTKSLKKLFIEEKIPAPLRDMIPIVCDQQGIVLIGGLGCDQRVHIDHTCSRVFVLQIEE